MNQNIIFCGVGGQGTVLASKITAAAALKKGFSVMSAETIGMAQKGGSVFSHLRIGENLLTPMIAKGEADLLIGFEPAEAVKMLSYLKKNGVVVVNPTTVMPVTSALRGSDYSGEEMLDYLRRNTKRLTIVNCDEACRKAGSPRCMNFAMLGAAAATGELGVTVDELADAIREKVKPQYAAMNLTALYTAANLEPKY